MRSLKKQEFNKINSLNEGNDKALLQIERFVLLKRFSLLYFLIQYFQWNQLFFLKIQVISCIHYCAGKTKSNCGKFNKCLSLYFGLKSVVAFLQLSRYV